MDKCAECGRDYYDNNSNHLSLCNGCYSQLERHKENQRLQEEQIELQSQTSGDVAGAVNEVKNAINNLSIQLSYLIDVVKDISEKLDYTINQTLKPLPLPPLAIYDSILEWMATSRQEWMATAKQPLPHHVALICNTPQAIYEICENLHNAFSEVKMASLSHKYKDGDLTGLLSGLSEGDVLIIRPELFPQGHFFDACTNNRVDIMLD